MTRETLMDVLSCALEGGIGYWACLDNTTPEWDKAREEVNKATNGDYVIEDIIIYMLDNGMGVKFEDAEDEEDSTDWILTKEKLDNGVEMWLEMKNVRNIDRYMRDNDFDCNDGDYIIQCALFGEEVYC